MPKRIVIDVQRYRVHINHFRWQTWDHILEFLIESLCINQ